jgi:hypothetical protein
MNYLIKYETRNNLKFKTTIQTSKENLKVTESLICAIAQAHYYDFNNHITPIDIINMSITIKNN